MALPISPPYPPMEALLVDKIPEGREWQYEPKWDGFRYLAFMEQVMPNGGAAPARVLKKDIAEYSPQSATES